MRTGMSARPTPPTGATFFAHFHDEHGGHAHRSLMTGGAVVPF